MSARDWILDGLLIFVALTCWVGVVGMLRMKEPMQALHYMTLPATLGVFALAVATLVNSGVGPLFIKTLLITLILAAINSVVTHATARAFRTRELGHWQPRDGDPVEYVDGGEQER